MKLDYEKVSKREQADVKATYITFFNEFCQTKLEAGEVPHMYSDIILPRLKLDDWMRLVELGVGNGYHLLAFADINYIGLDMDKQMVANARHNALAVGLNPERILHFPGYPLPLKDASIPRILTVNTLHEELFKKDVLKEFDRVLEPGGIALIVDRMCAIDEGFRQRMTLKHEPKFLRSFFCPKGYFWMEEWFKATYAGESLVDEPLFTYYLFSVKKPKV